MLVKEFKGDLQPKFDSRKSFYGKAQIEQIKINGGDKVYLLYSYNSIVSAIIETKEKYKYFYLFLFGRYILCTNRLYSIFWQP